MRPFPVRGESRVLVMDATNIAARSFNVRHQPRAKPQEVFGLWTEYLAWSVDADLVVGVFDNPSNRNKPASALFPFRSYLEARPGSIMTTSSHGQEADGAIVNIARRLESSVSGVFTYVASGDSDLQAVIAPRTSWVEILPCPSKSAPGGLVRTVLALVRVHYLNYSLARLLDGKVLHGLEDWRWGEYFEPQQYSAFLALRGKEDVRGVGIGEQTAAKLVRDFGDVERMLGADQNALRSWDVKVRRTLEGKAGRARLAQNAAAFGFLSGRTSAEDVVADQVVRFVTEQSRVESGDKRENDEHGHGHKVRYGIHPMLELHHRRIRDAGAERLLSVSETTTTSWRVVVDGWFVDAVLDHRVHVMFVEVEDRDGGIVAHPDDLTVKGVISQALGGTLTSHDPFKLSKGSSLGRYLALLKKHCPRDVLLLPVPTAPRLTGS